MFEEVKYLERANDLACPVGAGPSHSGPCGNDSTDSDMDRLQQIQISLLGIGERLRQHIAEVGHRLDFTPQQALLLDRLGTRQTMGQLANGLKCDPSNVTGLIRRLEIRGLVVRETDKADRRTKWLSLTPAGLLAREALLREMFHGMSVLDGLDDEAQEQLLAYLRVVGGNVDAGPDACLSSQQKPPCPTG
ncbi:MAG: hypothetical protein AVDCRST_MAG43-1679 [uncultured Thermomicrobiales bacterium]|uniref:HTH marR-type domain-containing protein n=1 Tax=uncultured Thermomicrobiales bacterium TaxID=1645740 RepID=A0A6J4UV35_9BACT|nr:MAG: hypothetical protein AVDCRST_MAG43-1679 [uncultured Thermomicrobiales bacterium]